MNPTYREFSFSQTTPIPLRRGIALTDFDFHNSSVSKSRRCFKKNIVGRALTALLPIVGHLNASAAETAPQTLEWKNSWSSPYQKALGGSQTAHAINEDAAFANPANLSRTRNPRSRNQVDVIDVPNLSLGGNAAALSTFKGKALNPSSWLKNLASLSSASRGYFEFQSFPWLVMGEKRGPTYFLGLPVRTTLLTLPSEDGGLTRQIKTQTTASAVLSSIISSRSGAVSAAISFRPNIRWNTDDTFSLSEISSSKSLLSDLKKSTHKTTSNAIDLGIAVTASDYWLPTFGLSVLNLPTDCVDQYLNPATGKSQSVCGAKRSGGRQDTIPETLLDPTEIRAGLSIIPRIRLGQYKFNVKISGDIYPLPLKNGGKTYGLHDVNINQLTHAGIELFPGNAMSTKSFSLRAGLNETRTSFGISLPMPHFTLEAASYEAALFSDGKAQKERRYLIGLSSDW
ncbi:MAG: hypothetical protein RIR26_2958 [Pseudomonadota bacterium]